MALFTVTMAVDGDVVVETVNAVDGRKAIKAAMDKHPTLILSVTPVETQQSFDDVAPEDHPGQTTVDDYGEPADEGMTAIGEEMGAGEAEPVATVTELPTAPDPVGEWAAGVQHMDPEDVSLEDLGPDGEPG